MKLRLLLICRTLIALAWGLSLSACYERNAYATIEIETTKGRSLVGEIDTRSDSQTLWVRTAEKNIVLTTAVPWANVLWTRLDGEEIAPQEVAAQVAKLKTDEPAGFLTEWEVHAPLPPINSTLVPDHFLRPHLASLEIAARLANLDRTVEPDGIVLAVFPIDTHGQLTPVCGSLSVRLVGELVDQHTGLVTFKELERWNAQIVESMFLDEGAVVRLRFRHTQPEFDLALCTSALLNVRLGVTGAGNFEASIPVELRTFNPFREQLQYYDGSRFFTNELTRRTRQIGVQAYPNGFAPAYRDW